MPSSLPWSGERMSTVKTTRPGSTLREFGLNVTCPTAADRVGLALHRHPLHHLDDPRHREPGVDPHRHRRRAGVRLPAGQGELEPPEPLAVGDDADLPALGLEDRPLLDVVARNRRASCAPRPARRPSSRSARARRRSACPRDRSAHRRSRAMHPREHARGQHRRREARALLVGPVGDHDRMPGADAEVVHRPHHLERRRAPRAPRRTCPRSAGCRDGCRHRPAARPGPPPPAWRTSCPWRRRRCVSPAASHQRLNSARPSPSASVRVWRLLPPATPGPIFAISMIVSQSRAPSILRFSPGAAIRPS